MDKEIYEKEKSKVIKQAIIIFFIIGIIILFLTIGIYIIKVSNIFKHTETCYSLDIDNTNKEQIVDLFKKKEIVFCDSLYKIEYIFSFPHYENITIYCMEDKNINIYVDNNSELIKYIKGNGKKVRGG